MIITFYSVCYYMKLIPLNGKYIKLPPHVSQRILNWGTITLP